MDGEKLDLSSPNLSNYLDEPTSNINDSHENESIFGKVFAFLEFRDANGITCGIPQLSNSQLSLEKILRERDQI